MPNEIGRAYESERGLQATCPTTMQAYVPLRVRFTKLGCRRAVWLECRLCDTHMHTRTDRDFDPAHPQSHLYWLDEVAYAP